MSPVSPVFHTEALVSNGLKTSCFTIDSVTYIVVGQVERSKIYKFNLAPTVAILPYGFGFKPLCNISSQNFNNRHSEYWRQV